MTASVVPVSSVSRGVPVTSTGQENCIVTAITCPTPYVPFGVGEETPTNVSDGGVTTCRYLLAPSDPAAPGAGSVRTAFCPTVSLIVPPLSASADADT